MWRVGLWIEVEKSDYEHVSEVWDDAERYPAVRFAGSVANDLAADLALPVPLGSRAQVHVPDPDAPPQVTGELAARLAKPWPKADFERYAVARGFL